MSECSHEESYWDSETNLNDWTGELETESVKRVRSFLEDIDTHRYHCTRCKEIFYYSSYGRSLYER